MYDANRVHYRRNDDWRDGEINSEWFVGEDIFAGVDV